MTDTPIQKEKPSASRRIGISANVADPIGAEFRQLLTTHGADNVRHAMISAGVYPAAQARSIG